jgi:hypothetical protein
MHHPHHEKHVPKFCKTYAKLGEQIHNALVEYKTDVQTRKFPTEEDFNPYKMSKEEYDKFVFLMDVDSVNRKNKEVQFDEKLKNADEYEIVKLY